MVKKLKAVFISLSLLSGFVVADKDALFKFGLWNAKPDFTGNKAIILIDIL
jgi:hypothetical protein